MIVICDCCREKVDVNLFFYNHHISSMRDPIPNTMRYAAHCNGKAICPNCGTSIEKHFTHVVSEYDIKEIAIKGYEEKIINS